MVPLLVVVLHKLVERTQPPPLPGKNQMIQTLLADRPDEPLGIGAGVRCLEGVSRTRTPPPS
jgi:hypothetical protein